VDPDDTKKTWDEFVRTIPQMWMQERFSHEGVCFSMPERAVLPKPLQKPHPPMWVTVTSPGTELDAADRGLGALGVATAGFAEQERRTREYHRRIQQCDPVGAVVNDRVATLNQLFCHEDLDEASKWGNLLVNTFGLANAHLLFTREAYPTRAYGLLANLAAGSAARRKVAEEHPGERAKLPEGTAVGDPKVIIELIKTWESIGIDQINFFLNAMEVIPQEKVLASLRLFAREVMPAFGGQR
jgi:alkanesulfonate monooxygenase SsuD/methylene tetrahydromethanopterin reductase-like flavin-dependent oxidoreductase (luciferase family)